MAQMVLDGVAEFREMLAALPANLAADAHAIVRDAAGAAFDADVAQYPAGQLRDGMVLVDEGTPLNVVWRVTNNSPLAQLWEYGTQVRHTAMGYNRGAMPSRPTFVPNAQRARVDMMPKLIAVLQEAGFDVSGAGV
jgi:hypothetical protein